MKKNFILSLLFFGFGFFTHALLFPEFFANGIEFLPKEIVTNQTTNASQTNGEKNAFQTDITYDGERFSKHNIAIEVGSYLTITNTNNENKLMWLFSNNPLLSTPRGYGESEQIRVRMDAKEQYAVVDKNNPEEKLIITVK